MDGEYLVRVLLIPPFACLSAVTNVLLLLPCDSWCKYSFWSIFSFWPLDSTVLSLTRINSLSLSLSLGLCVRVCAFGCRVELCSNALLCVFVISFASSIKRSLAGYGDSRTHTHTHTHIQRHTHRHTLIIHQRIPDGKGHAEHTHKQRAKPNTSESRGGEKK